MKRYRNKFVTAVAEALLGIICLYETGMLPLERDAFRGIG